MKGKEQRKEGREGKGNGVRKEKEGRKGGRKDGRAKG